ncbi:HNH endonuclease [Maritimibacter alkaliphilus HTCC2654]|uniref:HNH endonuclease n=1 Tax=Maritimibacter alkaliphilus TaxID=404236 RepID=UPI00126B84CE|nr:HNH endonuclease [Maritimibacter alkaliphilus]TYP79919.1 HNH endonuclease [Maritimibacter alkaliphilus HTCC2654]
MDWKTLESRPGSFSKNFGWGDKPGLGLLHEAINAIFASGLEPVPRDEAREIIDALADGDPLVPLNFFLYHRVIDGVSCVVPDQLVVEAQARDHDKSFDLLGMCALNFSRVGVWERARPFQSHPAPWARRFVVEEVWNGTQWDTTKINSDTIEDFLKGNMIFGADRPRKFATNLNYLYHHSGLIGVRSSEKEDWWASAVFLFLDRCIMDGELDINTPVTDVIDFFEKEDLWALTAANPRLARFAARPIVEEYKNLLGLERLGEKANPPKPRTRSARTPLSTSARRKKAQARRPQDLGMNSVQRAYAQAQRQIRNKQHAMWVKGLYGNRCAICGKALVIDKSGSTYSEAGHVKPVGDPFKGPDHFSNILPFCPNHHKAFDRGGVWIDPNGASPRAMSTTNDLSFSNRPIDLEAEHAFDLTFAEWHAKYFGHIR